MQTFGIRNIISKMRSVSTFVILTVRKYGTPDSQNDKNPRILFGQRYEKLKRKRIVKTIITF